MFVGVYLARERFHRGERRSASTDGGDDDGDNGDEGEEKIRKKREDPGLLSFSFFFF